MDKQQSHRNNNSNKITAIIITESSDVIVLYVCESIACLRLLLREADEFELTQIDRQSESFHCCCCYVATVVAVAADQSTTVAVAAGVLWIRINQLTMDDRMIRNRCCCCFVAVLFRFCCFAAAVVVLCCDCCYWSVAVAADRFTAVVAGGGVKRIDSDR